MKAFEIYNQLIRSSLKIWGEETGDGLIVGDPNKEVRKIAACFKLTMPLVDQAVAQGIDMVITHEPTFSRDDPCAVYKALDEARLEKLRESGLTVYRYHDHAHDREPDYIHQGFLEAVGLKLKEALPPESFAVRRYALAEPLPLRDLVRQIKEKLSLGCVRLAGDEDVTVKTVCLALGWVGLRQVRAFVEADAEVYITGETDEVFSQEYVRDACYFGHKKAMLLLGHYGAEYAGMKLLAKDLNETLAPTVFLDGGEVFRCL